MTSIIHSGANYHNATPAELYELFMDSAKHTAATGAPARVSRKAGGKWSAFGGMILGRNLDVVPNRRIVQTWRSSAWKKADPDSILVVHFEKSADGGASVKLDHIGVPEYDHDGVTQSWVKYYWEPWKNYLATRKNKPDKRA